LKTHIKDFGGPEIASIMSKYEIGNWFCSIMNQLFPFKHPERDKYFRMIRAVPDKEGKTRMIAIGDYFSQTVLKKFHKLLFSMLRRINQDCTFDQGAFKSFLIHNNGEPFYSFDLSQATDRFPIICIETLLKGIFPESKIDSWSAIMVNYAFNIGRSVKQIRYEVGNPMGFYSS
jgi:hypothetical protein